MFSSEGEEVKLQEVMYPTGNVEDWMLELERIMRETLRLTLKDALDVYPKVVTKNLVYTLYALVSSRRNVSYPQTPRPEWVLQWPGQIVIGGCQTFWTTEVTEALEKKELAEFYPHLLSQVSGEI